MLYLLADNLHGLYVDLSLSNYFIIDILMGLFIAIFLVKKGIASRYTYLPILVGACLSIVILIFYYHEYSSFLSMYNQEDLVWNMLYDKSFTILRALIEGVAISSFFLWYKLNKSRMV